MTGATRGPDGQYIRTIKGAQRDAEAARLRAMGWSYQQIADDVGFPSKGNAHRAVERAFAAIVTESDEHAKRLDLERIDRLIEAAWGVLERQHVTVSQGKIVGRFKEFARDPDTGAVVRDNDDKPIPIYEELEDDAPVLAAIDRVEKLLARRGKIIGYEAPAKSRVEIVTAEMIEEQIAQEEALRAAGAEAECHE